MTVPAPSDPPGAARPKRSSAEFATQVRSMFDRIAGVYDAMNRVMTAGLDERLRQRTVDRAEVGPGDAALDACTGTGDLAFALARRIGPSGRVVGSDFSEPMLERAREKELRHRHQGAAMAPVVFEWADALDLPYAGGSFDAVTVGFGVRNLADLESGIAELARVLRPGGRLAILEITRPQRQPLATFFAVWFDRVVPLLGRLAGDPDAYGYLPDSVRTFPPPRELAAIMSRAGLERVRWRLLAGGIIAIHSGVKAA